MGAPLPLNNIQLRKLLKIAFLDARSRRSELRADIRDEIGRGAGEESSGGDFYLPFWADAKAHVFGERNLHDAVNERIAANGRRQNLYPQLRTGFFQWWNERRRLTNVVPQLGPPLKARFPFPGLPAVVKVDSLLSVTDGAGTSRYVYPYFSPEPTLSEDAAQLALWLLGQALPNVPLQDIRVLDVIRGRSFSVGRTPLRGDEEARFRDMYQQLLREREELRREYD